MNPRIGANPEPAQKRTSGTLGSAGSVNALADGRTATCTRSPGLSFAKKLDATPRNWSPVPEIAGSETTETVRVQWLAFQSGEEEMEYCRTRIVGSMLMNVPREIFREGLETRISSTLRCLSTTAVL